MAFWDVLKQGTTGYPWNPTPGAGQRNDYSIPLNVGTPIQAPVSGIVLPENTNGNGVYSYYGRKPWGGEVDVLSFMPQYGGLVDVNLLHFDTINVKPGDVVIQGQTVLGTSGGQTSGGNMPSSPQYSTGPHIGVGVHAVDNWNRMYNPQTLISSLLAGQDGSSIPSQSQIQGAGIGWLPRGGTPAGTPQPQTDPLSVKNIDTPSSGISGLLPQIIGGLVPNLNVSTPDLAAWLQRTGLRVLKIMLGAAMVTVGVVLFAVTLIGPDLAAGAATSAGVPEAAGPIRDALRLRNARRSTQSAIQAQAAISERRTLRHTAEVGRLHGREQGVQEGVPIGREAGRGEGIELMHNFFVEQGRRGARQAAANRKAGKPPKKPKAPAEPAETPVFFGGKQVGTERGGRIYNMQGKEMERNEAAPPSPERGQAWKGIDDVMSNLRGGE